MFVVLYYFCLFLADLSVTNIHTPYKSEDKQGHNAHDSHKQIIVVDSSFSLDTSGHNLNIRGCHFFLWKDVHCIALCSRLLVSQIRIHNIHADITHMNDISRMVVLIVRRLVNKNLALHFVTVIRRENTQQLIVIHLFHHAIGTNVKVVTRLNISDVYNVRTHKSVFTSHYGTSDDIALRKRLYLVISYLASLIKVVNQGMVAALIQDIAG